ncbi:hypothetical protein H0R90_05570 [Treponema putidum]|uniref:hypothetical protein n=1 Tax=Treponema putidum TaxID=221027 RepID=UPI0004F5D242|nr:hypothetical protein [Treponema putidum]AIN94658.1 hypothetical protein JO40_11650 [Treponema putidum]TWI77521.1 hypothetical protein JM98_01214 [Treponema putidum]
MSFLSYNFPLNDNELVYCSECGCHIPPEYFEDEGCCDCCDKTLCDDCYNELYGRYNGRTICKSCFYDMNGRNPTEEDYDDDDDD